MHYPVFEHLDTLSFAFLVCVILYIDGKQSGVAFSLLFSIDNLRIKQHDNRTFS